MLRRPLPGGVDRNVALSNIFDANGASPPSRGRGSKLIVGFAAREVPLSPPSRGRGSKQMMQKMIGLSPGRPLPGGVDRNLYRLFATFRFAGRPLPGGVDRNFEKW